ncbi:hypothetical protein WH7805_03352 [Synechococcus sp. WH 7805]|nr:hypothetical protein WH7805_03352 [Synechococcus sp. WH 7805]
MVMALQILAAATSWLIDQKEKSKAMDQLIII